MSVKVMALVWDAQGLTSSEKLVLLAYADHASHDGTGIWPAVNTVSMKTSLSERTVQRTTRMLEDKGYMISDGSHDSGTNMWKIPLDMGGDMVTPPGRHSDTGGVTLTTRKGDTVTPEPSLTIKEPSNETINKIGGGGFYIFNLVGYDYNDANSGLKKAINALFRKHGEYRICQLAVDAVVDNPDVTLPNLLSELAINAKDLPITPIAEVEGDYY